MPSRMDVEDEQPLIVAGGVSRTLAAIETRARRAATGLAGLGVAPNDTLALLLHNDIAVFEAQRAATLLGAVAVPLDRHMDASDLLFILRDCAATVLIAHADLVAALRARLTPALRVVIVPTPVFVRAALDLPKAIPSGGDPLWEEWLEAHAPLENEPPPAPPALVYTSGSTGRPKGVLRHGSRSDGSRKALRVYGFDRPGEAVALVTGPLFHSVPRAFARLGLDAGADLVLMARFEAEAALALIARHRVTHVHLSPAMMVRMLRLPGAGLHDLRSLRHVIHGAAPCPPAIKAEAIAVWGPIIHEYYGSTETGLLTLADSADAARRPGSVGRALPGITLAVLDATGHPVPAGTAGTIYAGSADLHRFAYQGRDAERAAIGRGDLVTAGDVGHLDADGYLFLRDRGRDLIPAGEATIVPAELEAAILGLPGVADCAVLGLPGHGTGAIVCACIEALPGAVLSPGVIRTALAGRFHVPDRIEIVERLPRADSGKIFKHALRARLAPASP